MEKLVIKKRDEITAWTVDAKEVCPNTLLDISDGLVVFVKIDGESKYTSKGGITVHNLFNPTKKTKFFGGKTPYANCEITAIDTATQFKSEWGFGGLSCKDKDLGIRAKVNAFGTFSFSIEDYFGFVRSLNLDENKTAVTREEMRDSLRDDCVSIVKSYISAKLAATSLEECQANMASQFKDIRKLLDKELMSRGLVVHGFEGQFNYTPEHEAKLDAVDDAKLGNIIGGLKNEGRRDDLTVTKDEAGIAIDIINATRGSNNNRKSGDDSDNKPSEKKIYCSRCGEANSASSRFCSKCGEKLHK